MSAAVSVTSENCQVSIRLSGPLNQPENSCADVILRSPDPYVQTSPALQRTSASVGRDIRDCSALSLPRTSKIVFCPSPRERT